MELSGKNKMLRYIGNTYDKKGSGLLVLYGEAGLGKTSLLQEVLERYEQAFYYQAVPASERQQASFLYHAMFPQAENVFFPTYEETFRKYAFETKQKRILMFDEFDYMLKAGDQFIEQISGLVNHTYTEQDFLIILCSSAMGFVANTMGKKMGKTASFIQGLIKMKEYAYSDIRKLCGTESRELSFIRYALMGGRPAAVKNSLRFTSAKEMICQMYLDREGIFYDYGIRYISENLREPNVYATILYAIANGHAKLNDLYRYTGFSRAKISVYLKNLIELDLVEKVYSYGAMPRDDSQKGIYRITNPMIHFWYHFVYSGRNRLEFMEKEQFYDTYIGGGLDSYLEYYYAKTAAQLLCAGRIQKLPTMKKCEEWVGKSGNIPIIAFPEQGGTIMIFTKRTGGAVTEEDLAWYRFCVQKTGMSCERIVVFSEAFENTLPEGIAAGQEKTEILSVFENILEY